MKKLIQDLPPLFELVVVLTIGFGLFLYTSITYIVAGNIEENFSWTSAGFYFIIIYEVISLLIIFYILSVRGWRLQDFYTEFKFRYIWAGIGLMLLGNVIGSIAITIAEKTGVIDNSVINFPIGRIEADWISLLLVIIINSVY